MSRVHAVVLAAGAGTRFGGGKLLAPFRGGVLLDGALRAALAAPARTVVLVTGADAEAVAAAAGRLEDPRLSMRHAADHAEGMAASLRAGIAALPPDAAGVLVFLGDMPDTPADVPPRLVAALEDGAAAAVPVFGGRRGHPVAFSKSLFPALLALSGDQGGRAVLAGLGEGLVEVDASDNGVLVDVDTPDDLAGLG